MNIQSYNRNTTHRIIHSDMEEMEEMEEEMEEMDEYTPYRHEDGGCHPQWCCLFQCVMTVLTGMSLGIGMVYAVLALK
jgi:hypothetical protein